MFTQVNPPGLSLPRRQEIKVSAGPRRPKGHSTNLLIVFLFGRFIYTQNMGFCQNQLSVVRIREVSALQRFNLYITYRTNSGDFYIVSVIASCPL